MKQKICIMGCGWLGFPLAKHLSSRGYDVHGTTTSKNKIEALKTAQIKPFLIQLTSEGVVGAIENCLLGCQTLIVNIPPNFHKNPEHEYIQSMKQLITNIETSAVEHVLFIGSTSVYEDEATIPIITENSPTSNSKKALQLLDVESLFQNNKTFKTTVLRFAGLFGADRHPAAILSGKTNLKNGLSPVNLIHLSDCIGIISAILQHQIWETQLNASTPTHPLKKDYYSAICKTLQKPVPEFDELSINKGKIINSQKLVQLLDYEFKVKL